MKALALTAIAVVVGCSSGAGQSSGVQPRVTSTAPQPSPSSEAEGYAINIRTMMGLRHDLAYIRSLAAQPGLDQNELGTPVSAAEAAGLRLRRTRGQAVPRITAALAKAPNFGGAWFDQPSGGVVTVNLTTAPTPAERRQVTSLLSPGDRARYRTVGATLAQLQALSNRIEGDPLAAPSAASVIVGVGVSVIDNVVTVGVNEPADVARVYARFGRTNLWVTATGVSVTG